LESVSAGQVATLVGIVVALTALIVLLALGGASRSWTGFGKKTLWQWLELLGTLAVPVVIAVAGFWFTMQQDVRQQAIEDQRAERERALEESRAQDEALQAYLDQMSTLLLEKDLKNPEESEVETQTLARARTLTVLGRLGPDRKRTVIEFLYEASLINGSDPVLELDEANLRGAKLSGAQLSGANLSSADLSAADLSEANLNEAKLNAVDLIGAHMREANLSDADLSEANLNRANLSGANLSEADLSEAEDSLSSDALPQSGEDDLKEANLSGADLSGANLSAATGISVAKLEQQKVRLGLATMPDGTGHAGQYVTADLEPALSLSVSDGWRLDLPEAEDELLIEDSDGSQLIFSNPSAVIDPKSDAEEPTENPEPKNAEGWVSWFQGHPNLEVSKPVPTRVGGISGVQIDVTKTVPRGGYSEYYCTWSCVPLYPSSNFGVVSYTSNTERFVIVDVENETVVINISALESNFDEFAPQAREVLDSLEWKTSQTS
jgi:uncharacterized protein YjbI with pentapeptide repeats